MNTEKLFFGSFFLIILAVAYLAWIWIDPPKGGKYGTYNPDARVNTKEFRADAPGCILRGPGGSSLSLATLQGSDGKLVIPEGTMISAACLSGVSVAQPRS